ncbi:MAG: transaldolase family protein [Oscillospiraceae bacterium]
MAGKNYFEWLTEETASHWNNDSALLKDVEKAQTMGAIGCTTNPPLSYEALTTEKEYYDEKLAQVSRANGKEDFAFHAMELVVRRLSKHFLPLHKEKGGFYGCVRAQVAPNLRADAEGMLAKGKEISTWGENVMVKIPGTKAGIWVLEELAALGIPTNPTVVTTVAQAVAAAEAYEKGAARAKAAGITPAWSTAAVVMGRLQDYLVALNKERNLGLQLEDLEWAALAVVKRADKIFREKGYKTVLQPAAFRCAMQVEQISGGNFCSTIHPKIQKAVLEADAAGNMRREVLVDAPVNEEAVERVAKAIPEFVLAYDPAALSIDEFDLYGANVMTLDGFDVSGWQKLVTL